MNGKSMVGLLMAGVGLAVFVWLSGAPAPESSGSGPDGHSTLIDCTAITPPEGEFIDIRWNGERLVCGLAPIPASALYFASTTGDLPISINAYTAFFHTPTALASIDADGGTRTAVFHERGLSGSGFGLYAFPETWGDPTLTIGGAGVSLYRVPGHIAISGHPFRVYAHTTRVSLSGWNNVQQTLTWTVGAQ